VRTCSGLLFLALSRNQKLLMVVDGFNARR